MKKAIKFSFMSLLTGISLFAGQTVANGYYPYGYGYAPAPHFAPQPYAPFYPPYPPRGYHPQAWQTHPYQTPAPESAPVATEPKAEISKPRPVEKTVSNSMTAKPAQSPERPSHPKQAPLAQEQKTASDKPAVKKSGPVKASDHKQAFIDKLLPMIERQNQEIIKRRSWLISLFEKIDQGHSVTEEDKALLKRLEKSYRVGKSSLTHGASRHELLEKVDIIPASLTLAQAANESAWGKSRFAREANNLFGIWTYDEKHGLLPKNREPGKKHFIRKFDSIDESVRYYMQMLNSHPAYAEMRHIRAELRDQQQVVTGHALADGLEKYSAKGDKYIDLIQQLIAQNAWASLDTERDSA